MRTHYLIKFIYPLFLAILLLILTFVSLRPAQAAPPFRPFHADILVTTTIQAALNKAVPGDTVIVPAGIYTESLTLSKAVSLTGVSSATTIIRALANQRVLTVTGAVISNSIVISGLTLTGGKVTSGSGFGGGILVNNNAKPLLQNLIVTNNQAGYGGGVFVDFNIPLTLVNVLVISNTATTQGGGLFGGGPITLSHSCFERNSAISGGGGGLVATALTLTNSEFISNTADGLGGGAGAIDSATLNGVRFEGNVSRTGGGGLYADHALALTNTQFLRNRANIGGGLYNVGTSNSQLVNALFTGNTVTSTGAALYLSSSGRVTILHTTIADTNLNSKAAIAVISGTVGVTNTIITSHTVGISQTAGIAFEDYNLYFGNILTKTGSVVSGGHSFNGNPEFVASSSDDYHLAANSEALNLAFPGLVNNDFEGDPRPLGDGPDIGFDESSFSPVLTITKTVAPANSLIPGQILTYTIVISNNGQASANNVLMTDTFPASITGASLFTTSTIPAGQNAVLVLTGTVLDNLPNGTVVTNTAYYSHTSGIGQASVTFTVAAPSLAFTKTVTPAGPLASGQPFTYTIVIANNGDADATNVLITDTLPASVTGMSLFTTTAVPFGRSVTFTLPVTGVTEVLSNTIITNTAFYSHSSGNGQADVAVAVAIPDLVITKTVTPPGSLTPGQTFTYTIIVANRGEAIANNVLISDTLPVSVTGTNLFTKATILSSQSVSFTLTATLSANTPDGAVITNTAFYSHTSGSSQASTTFTVQNNGQNHGVYLPLILKN